MRKQIHFYSSKALTRYRYFIFIICLLLSRNIYSQNLEETKKLFVGSYMTHPNKQDSLTVFVSDPQWVCVEYLGICKIGKSNLISKNLLCAKNNNIMKLIDALVYIRDKAYEWNDILEARNISSCEKEFKKVSFPRLDLYVKVPDTTYHMWSNKRFIKKASFVKTNGEEKYKIILFVSGSKEINHELLLNIFVNDEIVLCEEDINKLIQALREALKCHENLNIKDMLVG